MSLSFKDAHGNHLYSHETLMEQSKVDRLHEISRAKLTNLNAASVFTIFGSLVLINKRAPFKSMGFAKKAGTFIGLNAALLGLSGWALDKANQGEIHSLFDGVAVWDSPKKVTDLSRRYFHLDDDQNFKPSLWHHGRLEKHGIGVSDISKLKNKGIRTVNAFVLESKKDLNKIKGFTDAKLDKIMKAARELIPMNFITAGEFLKKRDSIFRVNTGSHEFNSIMNGGIEGGSITEIFGQCGTGKSQICHTLCVTCQMPRKSGGAEGKAVYIDTENTFRPERIRDIAARYDMDAEAVLNNISFARANNVDSQFALLVQAAALMTDEPYSLLIIDSITHNFRQEYNGRGELSIRQITLNKYLRQLQKIADTFGVAVVITNQVVAQVDGGIFAGDPTKPIGGHILGHSSTTRLYLKKSRGDTRICKIYDSPCLPAASCRFRISEGGICDLDD